MESEELLVRINEIAAKHGEWTYDIPLKHGIWTKGNKNIPHVRLKRIVQVAADLCKKNLASARVLDLGCLDGIFSIEFANQGAETIGIDIREDNIVKCQFYKEVMNLKNVQFITDDVRNVTKDKYGQFDIIICSGLLYHLDVPDSFILLENLFKAVNDVLIIDTHFSQHPNKKIVYKENEYAGNYFNEFPEDTPLHKQLKLRLAAYKNPNSFWFSRPSLVNYLSACGFSSVYECLTMPNLDTEKEGLLYKDRSTFIAVKGDSICLTTSPAANDFEVHLPENLYGAPGTVTHTQHKGTYKKFKKFIRSIYK